MHSINETYRSSSKKRLDGLSHLEVLDVYARIILKQILSKYRGRMYIGIARLRTGISLGQHIFRI
jgi:hypothetical protein